MKKRTLEAVHSIRYRWGDPIQLPGIGLSIVAPPVCVRAYSVSVVFVGAEVDPRRIRVEVSREARRARRPPLRRSRRIRARAPERTPRPFRPARRRPSAGPSRRRRDPPPPQGAPLQPAGSADPENSSFTAAARMTSPSATCETRVFASSVPAEKSATVVSVSRTRRPRPVVKRPRVVGPERVAGGVGHRPGHRRLVHRVRKSRAESGSRVAVFPA